MSESKISFTVKKKISVIQRYESGWAKELNLISWNEDIPKFDIRNWSHDHQRMQRGIMLTEDEARTLYESLKKYFEEA